MPTDDRIRHHDSSLCPCSPEPVEDDDAVFYMHNALDGRETNPDLLAALTGWIVVGPKGMHETREAPIAFGHPN